MWLPTLPKPYVGEQSYVSLHCPTSTKPTHQHIQPTTLANLDMSTMLSWRYEPTPAVPPSQWLALGGYQQAYMRAYPKFALYQAKVAPKPPQRCKQTAATHQA